MSGWLLFLAVAWVPRIAGGYGYQYMMENKERLDQRADKIFVSKNAEAPRPYEKLKDISYQEKTQELCLQKMKRKAVHNKADGIVSATVLPLVGTKDFVCEGTLIRWQPSPTPSATANPQ